MRKRHWLDLAEYASIVGLGVGSVASVLSTLSAQVLYTTAPLSLLVMLNMANRRRLEQQQDESTAIALADLDQRLMLHLEKLHEQVLTLPTIETVGSLRKSMLLKYQDVLEKLSEDIGNFQQEMQQRLAPLEQQNLGSVRREVRQIREQCAYLGESVGQLSSQLQRLSASGKVEGVEKAIDQLTADFAQLQSHLQDLSGNIKPTLISLQDQITHYSRQVQKLPPPIDPTSIKREIEELVRIVGDAVPKRDMSALVAEVQALQQQQDRLQQSIAAIESAALSLKQQLGGEANLTTVTELYPDVQQLLATSLQQMRSQLAALQQSTQALVQQQQQIHTQVSQLPQPLDIAALQRQVQDLSDSFSAIEGSAALQRNVKEILRHEFRDLNQQLQSLPSAVQYEFIFDLKPTQAGEAIAGSRAALEAALAQTQQRLILILPWSSQCPIDRALLQQFEAFLQRGKRLDLGWCYQADWNEERFLSPINRGWLDPHTQGDLQETLNQLLQLKRSYPDRFRFKILGTAENFLVSDQSFAVMGIHNTLTTNTALTEMQLKLRTTDPKVVQRLIDRFDHPTLDPQDLAAHWNRAVTRYDLGDKSGAIADYTHVLTLQPDDATTYNHRGVVRYDLGDRAEALADFNQSLQLNPHQIAAYCNRGFIQAELGDWQSAIADYSAALQQPSPIAYFYRGMAHHKRMDYASAIRDLSEALRFAPESAVARYYRGITYQKSGQHQAAITDLERAAQRFIERGSTANAHKALGFLERSWNAINEAASGPPPGRSPAAAPAPSIADADWESNANLFPDQQISLPSGTNGAAIAADELDPETVANIFERF